MRIDKQVDEQAWLRDASSGKWGNTATSSKSESCIRNWNAHISEQEKTTALVCI